jgi:hypothetical protein
MPAAAQTSRHAFDFNHGDWIVTNRRLKGRGAGSTDWDVFTARQRSDLRLGGMCSLDEIDFAAQGFKGMTFRSTVQSKTSGPSGGSPTVTG